MPSSISSFDGWAPAKVLATAAAVILLAWLAVPARLPFDEESILSVQTHNEFVLERYSYEHTRKPIVVVGSSIATMIPPAHCRADNAATIDLAGGSSVTALETIRRIGARPEVLFVEARNLIAEADEALLKAVFVPGYWRLRNLVAPLHFNRNWVVLLWRWRAYKRLPPSSDLAVPPMPLARWNQERMASFAPYMKEVVDPASVRIVADILTARVRELQRNGTRIVFYNPVDPRIRAMSPMKDLKAALREALPEVDFIDAPDDQFPIYRPDGMHFTEASGLQFFNYLMQRAGVAPPTKCRIVPPS
jgi:hypothetical protein